MTTVIVSVILSALAALVTCVLLARFDVGGRMAAAKNGGQQSKAVGQKRERYILYIPRKGYFCFHERCDADCQQAESETISDFRRQR